MRVLRPEGKREWGEFKARTGKSPGHGKLQRWPLQKEVRAQRKVAKPAGKMIQSVRSMTTQT